MFIVVISFIVLLSPLLFAILVTSKLPMRQKIIYGVASMAVLVFLPVIYFYLAGS